MFQMLRSGLLSIVAYAALSWGVAYGGDKTAPSLCATDAGLYRCLAVWTIGVASCRVCNSFSRPLIRVWKKPGCYSLRNP